MKTQLNLKIIALILFLINSVGCSERSNQLPEKYSDSLVVLEQASEIIYATNNGSEGVSYKLPVDYPAKSVLTALDSILAQKGWTPLNKDWLNPELSTSHVIGWEKYVDTSKGKDVEIHSWQSNWINSQKDIVVYTLRYKYPVNSEPNMKDLYIDALYVPHQIADDTKKTVQKYKKDRLGQ